MIDVNDMERTLVVVVLIGIFVMLLILDGSVDNLKDRVKQLEQVEEIETNRRNIEGAKQEEQANE